MIEPELTPSVETPVVETPSEEPAAIVEPEAPVVEPEKFKMPDGRELTGAQVREEYDNLNRDYTQKSQKLAELTKPDPNINNVPEWKREGYIPQSYAEIIEIAEKQALGRIKAESAAEAAAAAERAAIVDAQIAQVRAKDPKLTDAALNALFVHANKFGIRDLNLAYENMAEMKKVATVTEERVLKGAVKKVDPIAIGGGNGQGSAVKYAPASSATEFLSRLGKK